VASSPQSFQKRQREIARRERAAAKRARRQSRDGEPEGDAEGPSEDELLEQFRLLNERHHAGAVTDEDFEARRTEIFAQLGLGDG
jgi:hypothetical protein